ncbi:unnamed protein product [Closterium sp. NIES-65]|nr:unnamed protein product [Closterium sp. NIES-65]
MPTLPCPCHVICYQLTCSCRPNSTHCLHILRTALYLNPPSGHSFGLSPSALCPLFPLSLLSPLFPLSLLSPLSPLSLLPKSLLPHPTGVSVLCRISHACLDNTCPIPYPLSSTDIPLYHSILMIDDTCQALTRYHSILLMTDICQAQAPHLRGIPFTATCLLYLLTLQLLTHLFLSLPLSTLLVIHTCQAQTPYSKVKLVSLAGESEYASSLASGRVTAIVGKDPYI